MAKALLSPALLLPLLLVLWGRVAVADGTITMVDVMEEAVGMPTMVAVQACAGLYNRAHDQRSGVFVVQRDLDLVFLKEVAGVADPPARTPVADFLRGCLAPSGPAAGRLVYNYTLQKAVLPVLLTVAGVLDAVPLQAEDPAASGVPVAFDALERFAGMSTLQVTADVYDAYANATTGLAFMNPGYDQPGARSPFAPRLTGDPSPTFMDHIVKERLFNFYLIEACIPDTADHRLMERMVAETPRTNPWPRPIPSYGYDDTFLVAGGYIFEAGGDCVREHNLGTVATVNATNLSFFSRTPAITTPMVQVPSPPTVYSPNTSYVALIVGDGDNVGFDFGPRFTWMQDRVAQCASGSREEAAAQAPGSGACYPLVWTLSPHLVRLAPDMLRWFVRQGHATGAEYFMLPPSGILYTYPSRMNVRDQAIFIQETEAAARLMNTSATIEWEVAGSWGKALSSFIPQYATNGVVRGVFPMNVPFMVPIEELDNKDKSLILNDSVVVFQPREWRGTNTTGDPPLSRREYYTPKEMAAELNGNPAGTLSFIYLTSDGGGDLSLFDGLVPMLGPHVEVVDANTLASLALQRSRSAD